MSGQWGGSLALVAWGVVSWFVTDNYIYVRIAGHHMRLHQVPALIAFLGGLTLFGAAGMILGPGILAVTVAVLDVWRRRSETATATEVVNSSPGENGSSGVHPNRRNSLVGLPAWVLVLTPDFFSLDTPGTEDKWGL